MCTQQQLPMYNFHFIHRIGLLRVRKRHRQTCEFTAKALTGTAQSLRSINSLICSGNSAAQVILLELLKFP
jgi:hypothetical protein